MERPYLLAEPQGEASTIVLSLHGSRSTPDGQVRLSRMVTLTAVGAVVAFPQGSIPVGSGFEWDHDRDSTFLESVLAALDSRHPGTRGRVCMTGMSGGARMSCHFASHHADQVCMVGAVAGLRTPVDPPLARPVPVVAFHGTADRINSFGGSGTARWDESVPDAARSWAVANGLAPEPEEEAVTARLTRFSFGHEGDPGRVTLWVARGAGHTWPGSRLPLFLRLFLGRTSMEVDATAEIRDLVMRCAGA